MSALIILLVTSASGPLTTAVAASRAIEAASTQAAAAAAPSAIEAEAFLARAEQELADVSVLQSRADWVNSTYITDDTDALAAYFGSLGTEMGVRFALDAARYLKTEGLGHDTRRKLDILRSELDLPAPTSQGAAAELSTIATRLTSAYGRGRGSLRGQPIPGKDLEIAMGTSRNPAELQEMWTSWHDSVGAPMRAHYTRLVEIANQGARELGYADVGALWRSRYDLSSEAFVALTDRLWAQVRPLYEQLHCYTRAKLHERYGDAVQPATGPIRADLLGNLWAQEWSEIYDIVAPKGAGDVGYDLTELLVRHDYDARRIVKSAENFFSSLGFAPLPATFWQRSMFTKPADRDVVCHASAWNLDHKDDLRIRMCTAINATDFVTAHHELGHNYYQRAYNQQPYLYRGGANDGFHEAIGDMVALSVTPEYLVRIGLLDKDQVPPPDKDIGLLLRQALDKIAFLPFGLMVDRWRWGVFDGSIPASSYTKAWDDLRRQYQGVVPPTERTEAQFDPGAKYHIPATVPYARYFLAGILQFQLYKAACDQSGWTGPLHRCSFYGNQAVGQRLNGMLSQGASKPWPGALEAFIGTRELSADALLEYFRPLTAWLQEQNSQRQCGW
ncbi:M2 family metallopeptidase [Microvirga yunnanensis]|uniref:M2 family metallopeptidase n=1 Tax=Microvirga yunnanensis TaxID=2953740 RepID=UPI0021C745E0|nr:MULTISPECIES: M2 family metallopeptidase [unclassified Microvirga]